jgi:hypothetical protein
VSAATESLELLVAVAIFAWLFRPRAGSATDESGAGMTLDGWTFVPDGDGVQILPPGWESATPPGRSNLVADAFALVVRQVSMPRDRRTGRLVPGWKPGEHLDPGDLHAARAIPEGDGRWRVEALGRDGDYRGWPFADEADARAVLALLDARVVRPVHAAGEWGAPADAFEDAWRALDETRHALSSPDEGWYTSMAGGWR